MTTSRWITAGALLLLASCATRVPTGFSPGGAPVEPRPDLGPVKPAALRPHQEPTVHVALALSGGGHRAANFALGVLLGLEEQASPLAADRDLLDEVDLVSSVSGGGFAAAAYVGSLVDYRRSGGRAEDYSLAKVLAGRLRGCDPELRRHLSRGYTDDILSAAWRQTRLLFSPLNRTDAFEQILDDTVLGARWRSLHGTADQRAELGPAASLRLRDVFVPSWSEEPVLAPHWVTNATAYENGAVVPFIPGTLAQYRVSGFTHRLGDATFQGRLPATGAVALSGDAEREYQEWVSKLPLSIGITASANFPGLLPPTDLASRFDPENDQLLLLDGGVADNLGVVTPLRLLDDTPDGDRRVLIVVDAFSGELGPFSDVAGLEGFTVAADLLGQTFLATWRGRAQEFLGYVGTALDIEIIVISFEDLMDPCDLQDMLAQERVAGGHLALTRPRLDELIGDLDDKQRLAGLAAARCTPECPGTGYRPFELLRAVATDFQCSAEEQALLVAAGRLAVARQRDRILAALR